MVRHSPLCYDDRPTFSQGVISMRPSFRLGLVGAFCVVTILVGGCVVLLLNPYSLQIISDLRDERVSSTQQASSSTAELVLLSPLPSPNSSVEVQQDVWSFAEQATATAGGLTVVAATVPTRTSINT